MFGYRYLENVVTLEYDSAKCNGCGMCVHVCPHAVFAMENKRAVLADINACMECGACQQNCETKAITVRAGVGCAAGVIAGALQGTEPVCGCSSEGGAAACCG